jgi:hypothetical protein
MATNVNWNGVTYGIPAAGEVNWPTLSNFLIALGQNAATTNVQRQAIRLATSSPVSIASTTDYCVVVDLAVAGATAANLPAGVNGQIFVVIDGKGDAGTNNITITPLGDDTIGGAATLVLDHNGQSVVLVYHAATEDWKIIANVYLPGTLRDQDIASDADIALSKLASLTANRAVVTDALGKLTQSAATDTEVSHLSGVTSAIQTQINAKAATTYVDSEVTGAKNYTDAEVGALSATLSGDIGTVGTNLTNHIAATSAHGVSGSVVGTTDTQTLDNKTLASPAITSFAQFAESSTPSTPSAGQVRLYPKTDGNFYKIDSNGVELPVGSGGGGAGEINAIENSSASSAVTGWDAATNYSVTRNTTDSPLAPTIPTCFEIETTTASSESSTSGVGVASFTMPVALRQMTLKLDLWVTTPATADGVWRVSLYKGSTRVPFREDTSGALTLPGGYSNKVTVTFDTDDSATYSLRYTQTTRTNANKLFLTGVVLGPGIQPKGSTVIEEYAAVGGTWDANSSTTVHGESGAQIQGSLTAAREKTITWLTPSLPTDSFEVQFADDNGAQWLPVLGYASSTGTGPVYASLFRTSSVSAGVSIRPGTTVDTCMVAFRQFMFFRTDGTQDGNWPATGTMRWRVKRTRVLNAVNLGSNDIEYAAWDGTKTVYSPNGALVPSIVAAADATVTTHTITWRTPRQVGDKIWVEVNKLGSRDWIPAGQIGTGYSSYQRQQTTSGGGNARYYGIGHENLASNVETAVYFGNAGAITNGAGYASVGGNYPQNSGDRYRLVKVRAGVATGFGAATLSQRGLTYNTKTLANLSQAGLSNNTTTTIASSAIALTAGTYRVQFGCAYFITFTGTWSNARLDLFLVDTALTTLDVIFAGAPLYNSTTASNQTSSEAIITLASDTSIQLRARIDVASGPTVSARDISKAYISVTRVLD